MSAPFHRFFDAVEPPEDTICLADFVEVPEDDDEVPEAPPWVWCLLSVAGGNQVWQHTQIENHPDGLLYRAAGPLPANDAGIRIFSGGTEIRLRKAGHVSHGALVLAAGPPHSASTVSCHQRDEDPRRSAPEGHEPRKPVAPNRRPPHLTAQQVADELNVTVETVREWIKTGELAATRLGPSKRGRIYAISPGDLDEFLRQRRVGRTAPSVDAEAEQILQTLRK